MDKFDIGGRQVGAGEKTFIIAEIGSNHDGRLDRAKTMIELAALTGADAVKFQSFTADGLVAAKVKGTGGELVDNPVHALIDRLTVPAEWHAELKECADAAGVVFLSTPFDLERLQLLVDIGIPAIKIASGDLTYGKLLVESSKTGKPVLLSTGMADMDEILKAITQIKKAGNEKIALMHCVSRYPTPLEDANIRAVATLAEETGLPVGLSDHTPGYGAAAAAVALGACIVEKHLTFDRDLPGPDHGFAMEPEEFKAMVRLIRIVEKSLGDGSPAVGEEEARERLVGRRSIMAARDIAKGKTIEADDLKFVRPGGGIEPNLWESVLGKTAAKAFSESEPLDWESLSD